MYLLYISNEKTNKYNSFRVNQIFIITCKQNVICLSYYITIIVLFSTGMLVLTVNYFIYI